MKLSDSLQKDDNRKLGANNLELDDHRKLDGKHVVTKSQYFTKSETSLDQGHLEGDRRGKLSQCIKVQGAS